MKKTYYVTKDVPSNICGSYTITVNPDDKPHEIDQKRWRGLESYLLLQGYHPRYHSRFSCIPAD